MKILATLFLALAVLPARSQTKPNTLSAREKKEGWQLLFDGRTTQGWHRYNQTGIGSAWKVADGCLYLDPSNPEGWQTRDGGDIVHERVLGDFHLKADWKIARNGNSGIMFYVQEDSRYEYPWQTGPEMQVLDNEGHDDGKIDKHRAGDLYDLIACSRKTVKPFNQWNHAEIICRQGWLTLKLNGVTVVHTNLKSESWKALIAGSKFASMPGFGSFLTGKIALQDHGNAVWFRNIKVKAL